MLGEDFGGVLVSDRFLAHDPLGFAKRKCLAHLLRTCGEVERAKTRGAVRFSRRVAALLRRAMALKRRRPGMSPHGCAMARGRLHAESDRLLAGSYTDPDDARLAKRLRKQRDHLLRLLDHEAVDATNIVSPFQYFLRLAMETGAEHPERRRREGGGAVG